MIQREFSFLVENDTDAERMLFSYGYGASLPTSAKRRLQHSVHLAKRVIQLEQANTSLRVELERERKNKIDTQQEVGISFCFSSMHFNGVL